MRSAAAVLLAAALAAPGAASARVVHVDAATGDDGRDGRSAATAWRTLARLSRAPIAPGTHILLHAGSVWREPLRVGWSGTSRAPIVIRATGRGAMPRIDAGGVAADAVAIVNVHDVRLSGLEVTNRGDGTVQRRGVLIAADDAGTLAGIRVEGMYVHDVGGSNAHKENGGIVFRTTGRHRPSRFVDLRIARNVVWRVDRSGIVATSDQIAPARWFPSLGVVIRDNYVEDTGGDAITPWATAGALVEHNIVRRAAQRAGDYNAGIWPWSTDDTLIQLNDVAATHGTRDGQGFDSDYNSRGTILRYNYSHDNDGGFLLVCTPVRRDAGWNIGNSGTVVLRNVSHHDHARGIQLAGADDTRVEGNALYGPPGEDVQMVSTTDWDGWSRRASFRANLFAAAGTARYGHQTARDGDTGRYRIAAGWGPARDIRFVGNRFAGRQVDRPDDPVPEARAPRPLGSAGWEPPAFDPARPAGFGRFLARHRAWMIALMTRQFGRPVSLAVSDPIVRRRASTPR